MNVGDHFVDRYGMVWKMTGYVSKPQATFERQSAYLSIDAPAKVQHVIGGPDYEEMGLCRLVKEEI
jgi:hypothetical protein